MLYRIRLDYARTVQASSSEEALAKVCRLMKEHPDTFIRDVQSASQLASTRPLWKRLLTGR